jgi:hypothetical protein
MRSVAAVLRVLFALFAVLSVAPSSAEARGAGGAASLAAVHVDESGDADGDVKHCSGHPASHPCCQSQCVGCASPPVPSLAFVDAPRDRYAPRPQIEPPSLAAGGIERPPRPT